MQFQGQQQHQYERREETRDTRGRTTGWIWMWSMIMMGPSIPMVVVTGSSAVPLAVLAAAALSTVAVWARGGAAQSRSREDQQALDAASAEAAQLRAQVEAMEERLFALETMTSYERAAAQRDAERASFPSQRDPLLPQNPKPQTPTTPWRARRPDAMEG